MADESANGLRLKVAVLSDLHFYSSHSKPDHSPSWLHVDGNKFKSEVNPWNALQNLIQSENLRADILLCPGDITTGSEKPALKFAWEKLNELREALQAKVLAAATGNHDVRSRGSEVGSNAIRDLNTPSDLIGYLKSLTPIYPVTCCPSLFSVDQARQYRTQYFGDDFVRIETDVMRLVVLNSCAIHTTIENDFERGFISPAALAELARQLDENTSRKLNILLCHHHPMQHENHDLGSYDFMLNGQLLTDLLSSHGDWMIFHGHKHHARLAYAPATCSNSPVVFAAASFSARLQNSMSVHSRNQFYLIDIALDPKVGPPMGTIRAWNWHNGCPWSENLDDGAGLPSGCGFGARNHPDLMAKEIDSRIGDTPRTWIDLKSELPWLNNLIPGDLQGIEKCLARTYKILLQKDAGVIRLIGRG
jgi:3',5'-cyclic AMP phosphodiesterase CpdA